MRLDGKTAIITGAGSGYGAGIAERFAKEGARIVVADINEAGGRAVVDGICAQGGQARFAKADVSKRSDVEALLATALDAFGSLQIVVNNAGITHRRQPILNVEEDEFDRIFSVNVKSLYHSAQVMVPYFRSVGGGVFVNVASIVSFRPSAGLAWYNSSKAAAVSASRSMALDFGRDNIRVNCVNPAFGVTGMTDDFMGAPDTPELREKFRQAIPLGRFTEPADVASACLYLASDDASFITGTCINVDGGRSV